MKMLIEFPKHSGIQIISLVHRIMIKVRPACHDMVMHYVQWNETVNMEPQLVANQSLRTPHDFPDFPATSPWLSITSRNFSFHAGPQQTPTVTPCPPP